MLRPDFIARQSRCPSGWLGWLIGSIMALETAPENQEALRLLEVQGHNRILEIGFGHGRALAALARRCPSCTLAGAEVSHTMLTLARLWNHRASRQRRLDLRLTSGPSLPFPPASFDRAYSVHTIYFWPRPEEHLANIREVLAPGGRFVLGFRPPSDDLRRKFPAPVYRFREPEEVQALLLGAGFTRVHLAPPSPHTRGAAFAVASR